MANLREDKAEIQRIGRDESKGKECCRQPTTNEDNSRAAGMKVANFFLLPYAPSPHISEQEKLPHSIYISMG